jgi:hypothetical protein
MMLCRDHLNKDGEKVHGSFEGLRRADVHWKPSCVVAPRLSNDLKKALIDLLRAEWKPRDIYDFHTRTQSRRHGADIDLHTTKNATPTTIVVGKDD